MTTIVECEKMCKHTPFGRDILSIKDVADWKEAAMRVADKRTPSDWNVDNNKLPTETGKLGDEKYQEEVLTANWERYTGISFKSPIINSDFAITPITMSTKGIATNQAALRGPPNSRATKIQRYSGGKKPKKTSPKNPKTAKK